MSQSDNPYHVVGTGPAPGELLSGAREALDSADVLVGGARQLAAFPDHPGIRCALRPPLSETLASAESMRRSGKRVVVLADGDPGFFGIGARMVREFGAQNVVLHPNVTVLQAAAARLRIPWEGVRTVSLHGRSGLGPFLGALRRSPVVGVYTDREHSPDRIAGLLLERAGEVFRMHVFENLGLDGERVGSFSLSEAREREFAELNFVLLERSAPPEIEPGLGMQESDYVHDRGMITKREVRAAGLAALGVRAGETVWDLGAGCGSVAVEASLLCPDGRVWAVESDGRRADQVRENARRTGSLNVETVCGRMPECLADLPDPDRVFVGGGLGRESALLETVLERLRPGGRAVLHVVLLGSLQRILDFCRSRGLAPEVAQIQVSRSRPLGDDLRLSALNPVHVVSFDAGGDAE
jgi:precorrin-6Y C5,15-methyltransferase (decarboxylating)